MKAIGTYEGLPYTAIEVVSSNNDEAWRYDLTRDSFKALIGGIFLTPFLK